MLACTTGGGLGPIQRVNSLGPPGSRMAPPAMTKGKPIMPGSTFYILVFFDP
jgi:hypothetical protein